MNFNWFYINFSQLFRVFIDHPDYYGKQNSDKWQDRMLLAYLLLQYQKGQSSPWWLLISNLPRQIDFAMLWSQSDLKQCEDKKLEAYVCKERKQLLRSSLQHLSILKSYPHLYRRDVVTLDNILWLESHLVTRCFGKYFQYTTMVPFAELFNHQCTDVYYTMSYDPNNPLKSTEEEFYPEKEITPQQEQELNSSGTFEADDDDIDDQYDWGKWDKSQATQSCPENQSAIIHFEKEENQTANLQQSQAQSSFKSLSLKQAQATLKNDGQSEQRSQKNNIIVKAPQSPFPTLPSLPTVLQNELFSLYHLILATISFKDPISLPFLVSVYRRLRIDVLGDEQVDKNGVKLRGVKYSLDENKPQTENWSSQPIEITRIKLRNISTYVSLFGRRISQYWKGRKRGYEEEARKQRWWQPYSTQQSSPHNQWVQLKEPQNSNLQLLKNNSESIPVDVDSVPQQQQNSISEVTPNIPQDLTYPKDWKKDAFDHFIMLCSTKDQFEQGAQVFFCYGRLSNRLLLLRYGIALQYNKYDFFYLRVSLPLKLEQSLLFFHLAPLTVQVKFKVKRTHFCHDLIVYCRAHYWQWADDLEQYFGVVNSTQPNSLTNESSNLVISNIPRALKRQLLSIQSAGAILSEYMSKWSKTIKQNEQLLTSPDISYHQYFSLVYRLEQQRMIADQLGMINYAEWVVKQLIQKGGDLRTVLEQEKDATRLRWQVMMDKYWKTWK